MAKEKKESKMKSLFEEVFARIEAIDQEIGMLEERLSPVLMPSVEPKDTTNEDRAQEAEYVDTLISLSENMERVQGRVREIRQRAET